MTWSYSNDPGTSPLDQVRFAISDTNSARKLLTDEEIKWLIARQVPIFNDPMVAAEHAALRIASKYTGGTSISADGVSIDTSGLQDKYRALAAQLREERSQLNGAAPIPYAGGMDPAEDWGDSDVAPLSFGTGMTDNPRAGRQDYGRRGWAAPQELTWP